jgi:hypothetical protein
MNVKIQRCNIEEKFKRLEKARQDALEMEKEENSKIEESKEGKQGVIPALLFSEI